MDDETLASYIREYRKTGDVVLRAKWMRDGARTLTEAARQLRAFACEIDGLAQAGVELDHPVEDDYAILIRPDDPDPPRPYEED